MPRTGGEAKKDNKGNFYNFPQMGCLQSWINPNI